MNDEDRYREAARLLDNPLVKEILATIENDAINDLLLAETDEKRREGRDTVLTIRLLRDRLISQGAMYQESLREPKVF